jgi:hypothetical protein
MEKEMFAKIVSEVAAKLGGKFIDMDQYFYPAAKIGFPQTISQIFIHESGNMKDRIKISMLYDPANEGRYLPYGIIAPSITVGAERSADKMAFDINRRFIPDFLKVDAQVTELFITKTTKADKRKQTLEKIVSILNNDTIRQNKLDELTWYGKNNHLSIQVMYDSDEVIIEGNIDIEKFLKICEVLHE